MALLRRIKRDLDQIRNSDVKWICDVEVDKSDIRKWTALLLPDCAPYNKGAFQIEINLPDDYPFKPPKITFKTKIYHPNINENGNVDFDLICPSPYCCWSPSKTIYDAIQALVALLNDPENNDHILRGDLATELRKDKKIFFRNAEEFTKTFAEKRPSMNEMGFVEHAVTQLLQYIMPALN